jgi:peptidyl-prolyl cis-trans isomerase D
MPRSRCRARRPASSGVAKLGSGDLAIVVVESVTDGDPKALDTEARTGLLQQIASARGNEDARAYIQALRKQYTITVAEDRL